MSNILRYRGDWSPDSRMFAWGMVSDDNCIYVWDRETDDIRELRGHPSSVWSVAWSPDSKQIASGGMGGKILIRDIATGEVKRTYEEEATSGSVAWSPDGELFVATIGDKHLRVWNSADGKPVARVILSISGNTSFDQLSWHPRRRTIGDLHFQIMVLGQAKRLDDDSSTRPRICPWQGYRVEPRRSNAGGG